MGLDLLFIYICGQYESPSKRPKYGTKVQVRSSKKKKKHPQTHIPYDATIAEFLLNC